MQQQIVFVFIHRCPVLPLGGWFWQGWCWFHATSQYQWLRNDHEIEDETYAILYTTSCVEYKCRVKVDEDIYEVSVFSVTGMLNNMGSGWYN